MSRLDHMLEPNTSMLQRWVRLAQRVPVHIGIDQVLDGVRLVAGMTATAQAMRDLGRRRIEQPACRQEFKSVRVHGRI
jgi:multidrug resistance efflux pump